MCQITIRLWSRNNMTSVLFSGGLNYQRTNPLQTEIRRLTNDIANLKDLITDLNKRLDDASVPPLPQEATVAYAKKQAQEAAAQAAARNTLTGAAASYARRG